MTLPLPIDQQIVDELATRLANIKVADGYYNTVDAQRIITEEHEGDLPDGDLLLEIIDSTEDLAKQSVKYRNAVLKITVRGFIVVDLDQARAKARTVLADMRKAIRGIKCAEFVTGVTAIELGGRRINPRANGSGETVVELDLSISYTEFY